MATAEDVADHPTAAPPPPPPPPPGSVHTSAAPTLIALGCAPPTTSAEGPAKDMLTRLASPKVAAVVALAAAGAAAGAEAGAGGRALFYATLLALLTIHAAVAEGTQAQAGGVGQRQQPAAAALTTAAYDVAGEAISIGEMRRRLTEASPTTRSRDFLN